MRNCEFTLIFKISRADQVTDQSVEMLGYELSSFLINLKHLEISLP